MWAELHEENCCCYTESMEARTEIDSTSFPSRDDYGWGKQLQELLTPCPSDPRVKYYDLQHVVVSEVLMSHADNSSSQFSAQEILQKVFEYDLLSILLKLYEEAQIQTRRTKL